MKRYKKEFDYSYALGMTVVFELLKAKPTAARRVYLHPDANGNEHLLRLKSLCRDLNVETVTETKIFNILSPKENCFVIGEFAKYGRALKDNAPHIVLVNPMNSGNLGTIARTALGLGYENIALIEPCADRFSPETVRASMGAVFSLDIETFPSFDAYRERFPRHNLYPFMLTASKSLESVEFVRPFSLVLGNEAHGLPDEFAELGQSVIIPCTDKVDSLNLAVAAAVAMYAARSQEKSE